VVTTTTTLTKSVDDMIRISKGDHEVVVRSEQTVMDRITALMYALEYIGVMPLDREHGLGYLQELTKQSRDKPGFDYLLRVDTAIRMEVGNRLREKEGTTFASEFADVLLTRKDFWATAAMDVARLNLERAQQASNTKRKHDSDGSEETPRTPRKRQRGGRGSGKSQRGGDKQPSPTAKALHGKGGTGHNSKGGAANHGGKDAAGKGGLQKLELGKIVKLKQADSHGKPICRFYNTTSGCKKGAKCNFAHVCAECEGGHAWATTHNR